MNHNIKRQHGLKAGNSPLMLGNLTLERGALPRERRASASRRRRHAPPNVEFDREVRTIVASWKSKDGAGPYASRAIANTAQGLQFPLRCAGRQIQQAIENDVPLARVEDLGHAIIRYARRLFARKAS